MEQVKRSNLPSQYLVGKKAVIDVISHFGARPIDELLEIIIYRRIINAQAIEKSVYK